MSDINKLRAIYFLRNFSEVMIYTYFSLFLAFRGFSEYEVSILTSLSSIVFIIFMPIMGLMDDGEKKEKRLLVMCLMVTCVLPLIYIIRDLTFATLFAIVILLNVFRAPQGTLLDSTASVISINNGKQFGDIRVWASISYIIAMPIGGLLFDFLGYNCILVIGCAMVTAYLIIIFTLPAPKTDRPKDDKMASNYKQLFRNKVFISFVIATVLTWTCYTSCMAFEGLYYKSIFNNAKVFGYMEAFRVTFEVLGMLAVLKGKLKFSQKGIYLYMSIMVFCKCVAHYFSAPMGVLIALEPFTGAAFGLCLASYIKYISKYVRKYNLHIAILVLTFSQTLMTAIYTYSAGLVSKYVDFLSIYIFYGIVDLIGILFIIFVMRFKAQPPIDSAQTLREPPIIEQTIIKP